MASVSEASCANDPNFAIICSFFEKFSSMLNIQQPDIQMLQGWLENSDEVAPGLRDLHIKLLRKMRKTVHETAWETALAKFCYQYSAQDAWEIERFGYKKSSLKVKLRILTAILEYQFQCNGKFRNKFSNLSAEELRSEPIGRDRLGHSYWLTQDPSCNFRIYQEHLDEEIWQVVASNRSEMETLISRLKGNEVVLPSLIGVIDEDSSSNSCANAVIKPPPPEEQDDSQSSSISSNTKAKVPNLKIKIESKIVVEKNGDIQNGKDNAEEKHGENDEEAEDATEEDDDEEEEGEEEEEDEEEDEGEEETEEELQKISNGKHKEVTEEDKKDTRKPEEINGIVSKIEKTPTNGKKLNSARKVKPIVINHTKMPVNEDKPNHKKRGKESLNGEPETEQPVAKKSRPTLSDNRRDKKSKYEKSSEDEEEEDAEDDDEEEGEEEEDDEDDEDGEDNDEEDVDGEEEEEEEEEETQEDEEKPISNAEVMKGTPAAGEDEANKNDDKNEVGEAIEEPVLIVKGEGSGKECNSSPSGFLRSIHLGCEDFSNEESVGEAIEEDVMYIYGEGYGESCLVGNPNEETSEADSLLLKHPKSLEISGKVKQIEAKLEQSDENKNNESKKVLTNGELTDDAKDEAVIPADDGVGTKNNEKIDEKENEVKKSPLNSKTEEESKKECDSNLTERFKENKTGSKEESASVDLTNSTDSQVNTTLDDDGKSEIIEEIKPSKSESPEDDDDETSVGANEVSNVLDELSTPSQTSKAINNQAVEISSKNLEDSVASLDSGSVNSRKRRLSEEKIARDLSESESDLNSDSAAPPTEEEDDVGGKRAKMRLKVVNTEIRKKIEKARKSHEDTKSTSEDETPGPVQENNNVDNNTKSDETDPLKISDQDVVAAKTVDVAETNKVPIPVLLQTRATRRTPAGTPIKVTPVSNRVKKKPILQKSNKKNPQIPSLTPETPPAEEEESHSDDDADLDKMPKLEPEADEASGSRDEKLTPSKAKPRARKRDIDTSNILDTHADTPVRQSRRIAQLKIREEAERRKLEEEALKKMKAEFKKKKKEEKTSKGIPAAPSESSEKSAEESEAEEGKKFLPKKKGQKSWKKSGWSSGPDEPEEDDEYDLHHDRFSEPGSPLFKSDHEFSCESDLEDESQAVPLKRARTVRKEGAEDDGDEKTDESCQKCGKNDHPEWILLCDNCDKGYHCSCLSPVLFIIPEGDWYCPLCQQEQLIKALETQLSVQDNKVKQKHVMEEEAKRMEFEQKLKEQEEEQAKAKEDEEAEVKVEVSKAKKSRAERAKRRSRPKKRRNFIADDDEEDLEDSEEDESTDMGSSSDESESESKSGSKSTSNSEDNEPIYKLRKRRQVNVSYRLNEYEDLINSAIKEEMDEVAGAGNLGRGKDISTIIEADKEEKLRQKQMGELQTLPVEETVEPKLEAKEEVENGEMMRPIGADGTVKEEDDDDDDDHVIAPVRSKMRTNAKNMKRKNRKLNNLEISSDDDGSDEDFKTSSYETEDDESISEPTDSDSSLEVYRKRGKKGKRKNKKGKGSRPQRRAARERRRMDDFIVEDSEFSDDSKKRKRKAKRKNNWELQDTESEEDLSEQIDSEELCDDTTDSEDSDGCWRPSKRRKTKAKAKKSKSKGSSVSSVAARSGKQPRKFHTKKSGERSFKGKSKSKARYDSDDDSDEDVPRTRGKRFTYLDSFSEESSDDGIKPGVKRPDTPPEEREKFIKKQEEIKRMLAEKNTEAAKAVATPTLAPVDSLSTVPLSVIKGAKALDIDYLQRKGELNSDEGDTDFDEDLPDDFDPEAMDEEEIAKMMEEEDLKLAGEVITPKKNDGQQPAQQQKFRQQQISMSLMTKELPVSQLQEPPRKRLPMPTIHPPLGGMPRFPPPGARIPYETPIRQHLPPTIPLSMQLPLQQRPMGMPGAPPGVVMPSGSAQNAANDTTKPRGRRKKITPLRDTLQKQQAAAAAAAAAAGAAPPSSPGAPTANPTAKDSTPLSLDKSAAGPLVGPPLQLSVAQPPQLYTPPANTPPSVITRMPQQLTPRTQQQPPPMHAQQQPPLQPTVPHRLPRPPFPDQNSRYYSPVPPPPNQIPQQQAPPPPQQHRMSIIRHGAPPPMSHHALGPSFASGPPPLRPASPRIPAAVGNVNRQPVPRPLNTFPSSEQYGAGSGRTPHPPPPNAPPHAYRPPLFGTPGYPPAPPQQSQTPMHPTGPDYPAVPTSYGPTAPYHGGPYYPNPHPPQTIAGPPPHSTPPPPVTASAVPVSSPVAMSPLPPPQIAAPAPPPSQQQPTPPASAVAPPQATPPTPHSIAMPIPPVSTESIVVTQTTQQPPPAPRRQASVLETFDSKSRSPIMEADAQNSSYSNSGAPDDNDDENIETGQLSNSTSEFSGLVSYFSSQHDDLNS